MQPKAKLYRYRATSPAPMLASRNCLLILLLNWIWQGVRGMDAKELTFRLLLAALLTAAIAMALHETTGWTPLVNLAGGLVVAHTLNFLANGQFWVCLRYCPLYHHQPDRLRSAVERLIDDVARQRWLQEAVLIGSIVTRMNQPGARSDVDLRLIFPPGPSGWLRTNLFLLRLRLRAFCTGLPLDVYAYDHPATLRRFDQHEPLGIILDRGARLRRGFANRKIVRLR